MHTIRLFHYHSPMQNAASVAQRIAELGREVSFTDGFSRAGIERSLQSDHSLLVVAKRQEQILAFALFSRALDEASLDYLAVTPSFQRQGVALSLLNYAAKPLREARVNAIFLEVRQDNQAAVKLYEKLGFQVIGIRPNYYHHPTQNALMMKCQCKGETNENTGH